jgi:dTDP-4-amino-4,6-dideoxygalactose transaminase
MSELQAAIGVAQIDRLASFNERRREISHRLFEELAEIEWLRPATIRDYVQHAYFWAPFEVDTEATGLSGKELWRALRTFGVETRHRYIEPLYRQPVFREHMGFNSTFPWSENEAEHSYDLELPNVEAVAGNTIGLPNHPGLTDADVTHVIEEIRRFDQIEMSAKPDKMGH